jgi:hypothetical protein
VERRGNPGGISGGEKGQPGGISGGKKGQPGGFSGVFDTKYEFFTESSL